MRGLLFIILLVFPLMGMAQNLTEMRNSYNYKRGVELLTGDSPDEKGALDSFSKELDEHPKNGYAWYCLGTIYSGNSQEGKALECLNKAVSYLKKDKEWLSYSYRKRAKVQQELGHDKLALADYNAAVKENPKDNDALNERANLHFNHGRYDLAEADYDLMIKNEPGQALGYLNKALIHILQKDFAKAEELCSYCIKLDPTSGRAYALRAWIYVDMGKMDEASDDAISALRTDTDEGIGAVSRFSPSNSSVLLAKLRIQQAKDKNNYIWPMVQGMIFENNEQYVKAIEAYKASYDICASDVFPYRIATCYSELGRFAEALDNIHQAIRMDSTDTSYLLMEGDILYNIGLASDAISAYTSYIEKEPDDYKGYYSRAFTKDMMGDIDAAVDDYTTTLVLRPDFNYALVERGLCYKLQGNDTAAKADWEKDIKVDTVYDNCCAHYAYAGLGQYDKAKEVMDSILAHSPSKGNYYDAACLYSRIGECDKAMEFLRTSMEKGFHRFFHIAHDRDMDGLRNRPDFKALIDEYKSKVDGSNTTDSDSSGSKAVGGKAARSVRISEIPFTRESGGLCKVKCNINGLPLNFWLDTGASDVSLSMVEATFMVKNGYLTKDDVVGNSYFLDANGNVSEGTVINLRKVKFGESELNNVKASVVSNLKAPLLLGQSILSRLGSVEIDNAKQVIRIKYY